MSLISLVSMFSVFFVRCSVMQEWRVKPSCWSRASSLCLMHQILHQLVDSFLIFIGTSILCFCWFHTSSALQYPFQQHLALVDKFSGIFPQLQKKQHGAVCFNSVPRKISRVGNFPQPSPSIVTSTRGPSPILKKPKYGASPAAQSSSWHDNYYRLKRIPSLLVPWISGWSFSGEIWQFSGIFDIPSIFRGYVSFEGGNIRICVWNVCDFRSLHDMLIWDSPRNGQE